MNYRAEREQVLEAARRTVALGLTHGTSGNVSLRVPNGMVITPTGLDYGSCDPADLVVTSLDGRPADTERRSPSSEWRLHAAVYQARPEINGVIHGHAPAATAVACLGRAIPAFHYMIAVAGGDTIRCARYAPFGTEQLASYAVDALADRLACLLAHHGFIAIGATLEEALSVAVEVEYLADLYLRLLPLGEPPRLSDAEMREVSRRFEHYRERAGR
jgi:L-fuculose-phosphate aldolase